MSALKRFFVNKIEQVTELSGEEFEHAKNVLRLSNGDEVILLDNSGKDINISTPIGAISAVSARKTEEKCTALR